MIYCVNEEGWSIVQIRDYHETYIRLRVGDKLYADGDIVTLIYVQSDYKGQTNWYWRKLDTSKQATMFTHESYPSLKSPSVGNRVAKCNLKMFLSKEGVVDITKSVDRDIKLNSLGI